ncbi:MAG: stage 0 sporulation family protein [Clostridia bacterium]|nr:stage 0 sporulation family protein [Clostridia bacterium]
MVEVIGVRFKNVGKIYYFDPDGMKVERDAHVIVETARGVEFGTVVLPNFEVEESEINAPLKKMLRIAGQEDEDRVIANAKKEREAFSVCQEKIRQHNLDMKLIDVEYTFDGSKILFYFTADGRVDFRELVKGLASVFRTRIELRQIGVRDEAKMLGGLGICGRSLCCSSFLGDFEPVSIKMAKEQSLSLNPTKISGVCGRLMCCLKYEQEAYEQLHKVTPKVGALVKTPDGKGVVVQVNLLRGQIKVKLDKDESQQVYPVKQLKVLKANAAGKESKKQDEDEKLLKELERD